MYLAPSRPSDERLAQEVEAARRAAFSYTDIGATNDVMPSGWKCEERQIALGKGEQAYIRGVEALRQWRQFDLPWIEPLQRNLPIETGEVFGFCSRQYGLWALNVCRIVYVIDDSSGDPQRFGFAYGTLSTHAVSGEEQFLVTRDRTTDLVQFSIRKFSKPSTLFFWLLAPVVRQVQCRFSSEALERVAQEVRQ